MDPRISNSHLCPVFCDACIAGEAAIVLQMLEADPSLVHCRGSIKVEYMRSINADAGWTPLHLAAHYGHLEVVRLLLAFGADTEAFAENSIGNTPISAACFGGRAEIVELLLEHGANPNTPNRAGYGPLHLTAMSGNLELTRLLLAYGANTEFVTNSGKTPIELAGENGEMEMVQMLREH